MNVYYDAGQEKRDPRLHPYTAAAPYDPERADPKGFIDFVAHPELIETSLEDFVPYAHTTAVRTFFDFLRWINGPESPLETCDCGMMPPKGHSDTNSHLPVRLYGRVFILFRDLQFNCSRENTDWLCGYFFNALKSIDPDLPASEAVIGVTLQPVIHYLLSDGKKLPDGRIESGPNDRGLGRHLMITWFAYGNTDEEAFTALHRTVGNLWDTARLAADEIRRGLEPATQ